MFRHENKIAKIFGFVLKLFFFVKIYVINQLPVVAELYVNFCTSYLILYLVFCLFTPFDVLNRVEEFLFSFVG